jgi:recombination protein RecR
MYIRGWKMFTNASADIHPRLLHDRKARPISFVLITESVSKLIDQLAKLPGIGRKSAERLTYHLLRASKTEALELADAIRDVKENVRYCKVCYNLSEADECNICRDPRRDRAILCVVEQPRDLIALESAGTYKGLYHVLLGRIAPLEGVGPDQLTIDALVNRIRNVQFKEVIMATNPTLEGDGTALFISHQLAGLPVPITRLARGITSGSVLEFANKEILADALSGRQKF